MRDDYRLNHQRNKLSQKVTASLQSDCIAAIDARLETSGAEGGDGSDTTICLLVRRGTIEFKTEGESQLRIYAHGDDEAERIADVFEVFAKSLRRAGFESKPHNLQLLAPPLPQCFESIV